MLKTRIISGKQSFYDSVTGQTLTNIRSVSFDSKPGIISTVITKEGVYYAYFPDKNGKVKLTNLESLINSGESIQVVN